MDVRMQQPFACSAASTTQRANTTQRVCACTNSPVPVRWRPHHVWCCGVHQSPAALQQPKVQLLPRARFKRNLQKQQPQACMSSHGQFCIPHACFQFTFDGMHEPCAARKVPARTAPPLQHAMRTCSGRPACGCSEELLVQTTIPYMPCPLFCLAHFLQPPLLCVPSPSPALPPPGLAAVLCCCRHAKCRQWPPTTPAWPPQSLREVAFCAWRSDRAHFPQLGA